MGCLRGAPCWEAAAVRYPLFDLFIYFYGMITILFQYSKLLTESLTMGSAREASLSPGAGSGSCRGAGDLSIGCDVEGVFSGAGAVRLGLGIRIDNDQTSRRTSLSFFRNSFFELQVLISGCRRA